MNNHAAMADGVALTAVGAAAARAVESSREDSLINDPFATELVAAANAPVPFPVHWPAADAVLTEQQTMLLLGANYVGIRSRFFDDFLQEAVDGGIRQVVILAAGLDTRAFRLALPAELSTFEIDQPAVLEFKNEVLTRLAAGPSGSWHRVAADLREDWTAALLDSGFEAGLPTAWLVEGLLVYLSAEEESALLQRLSELSAVGSLLAVESAASLPAPSAEDVSRLQEASERSGLPMSEILKMVGSRPKLSDTLAALRWQVTAEQPDAVAARYGRSLVDPRFAPAGQVPQAPTTSVLLRGRKH